MTLTPEITTKKQRRQLRIFKWTYDKVKQNTLFWYTWNVKVFCASFVYVLSLLRASASNSACCLPSPHVLHSDWLSMSLTARSLEGKHVCEEITHCMFSFSVRFLDMEWIIGIVTTAKSHPLFKSNHIDLAPVNASIHFENKGKTLALSSV